MTELIMDNLLTLSKRINVIRLKQEAEQKIQHSRFNVFTTLLNAQDEVRLHTRFIHMLLNPNGKHDCGRLFLDLFLDSLHEGLVDHAGESIDSKTLLTDLKNDKFVYGNNEEARRGYGQFDLFLEFENHIILIENKIWAGEQHEQMARYARFLDEKTGKKRGLLLYLTIDGKAADSADGHVYCRISYKSHIRQWLERCLQSTYKYVNINQSLQQYQYVVESLSGLPGYGRKEMNEIKQFLKKHPDIIGNLDTLTTVRNDLYYDTVKHFFDTLLATLTENGIECAPRPNMNAQGWQYDAHAGFILKPVENDFTAGHNFELWLERNDSWRAVYVGIESNWKKEGLSEAEEALLKRLRNFLEQQREESNLHLTDPGQTWGGRGWLGAYWPVGRTDVVLPHSFSINDNAYLERMLNSTNLKVEVAKARDNILTYVDILRQGFKAVRAQ